MTIFDDPRRFKRFLNRIEKKTRTPFVGFGEPDINRDLEVVFGMDRMLRPKWQTYISMLEFRMNRTPRRCADVVIERLRGDVLRLS